MSKHFSRVRYRASWIRPCLSQGRQGNRLTQNSHKEPSFFNFRDYLSQKHCNLKENGDQVRFNQEVGDSRYQYQWSIYRDVVLVGSLLWVSIGDAACEVRPLMLEGWSHSLRFTGTGSGPANLKLVYSYRSESEEDRPPETLSNRGWFWEGNGSGCRIVVWRS